MKAVQIQAPGQCEWVDIGEPRGPGEGEVLLKLEVVGYCGSDLSTFRGLNPLVSYPRIPGHEIGATVAEIGPGVDPRWKAGMQVLVSPYRHCGRCLACRAGRTNACRANETLGVQRDGAMTEAVVVPADKLFSSPRLDFAELALVEPLTVGFHAVERGEVGPGDVVGVFGCGAIGLGAIAGAAAREARVIAIDIDAGKLDLARRCGAAEMVHAGEGRLEESLMELTGGHGPHVLIEAVGSPSTFRSCVELVGFAGRVVYIGYAKAPVEYETKHFVLKELDIRGSRNALPEDFERVIGFLETGVFPVEEVVTRTVSLAEAPAALKAWDADPSSITKVQVRVGDG